jgi:predicted RNA-binding protein
MIDYILPYFKSGGETYYMEDLVLVWVSEDMISFDDISDKEDIFGVTVPFNIFADFGGTLKKRQDEYLKKIEDTSKRQEEEDLKTLDKLMKKYKIERA